jgi:hypothetical protein
MGCRTKGGWLVFLNGVVVPVTNCVREEYHEKRRIESTAVFLFAEDFFSYLQL